MKNLFHKFKPQIKTALSILSVVAIGFSAIMAGVTINTKSVKADYEDATISPDGSYPAFNVNVSIITHYFIRMNMIRLSIVQNMITVVRQQQQATDIRQASHPYRLQHREDLSAFFPTDILD